MKEFVFCFVILTGIVLAQVNPEPPGKPQVLTPAQVVAVSNAIVTAAAMDYTLNISNGNFGAHVYTNTPIPAKFHTADFTNAAISFVRQGHYCDAVGHKWVPAYDSFVHADYNSGGAEEVRRCATCGWRQSRHSRWSDWR